MVTGHDAEGNATLGDKEEDLESGEEQAEELVPNAEEDQQEESECVICLETFEVGDKVAWSSGHTGCKHVWHAECIRSWLRESNHEECPSCRETLLPEKPTTNTTNLDEAEEGLLQADEETEQAVSALITDCQFVILKGQDCVTALTQ